MKKHQTPASSLWTFLLEEKNQKTIAFFATGLAALAGASWTAFTYIRTTPQKPEAIQINSAQVAGTVTVQGNLILGMTKEAIEAQTKQQIEEAMKSERAQRSALEDELNKLKSQQKRADQTTEELRKEIDKLVTKNSSERAVIQDRKEILRLTSEIYGTQSPRTIAAMNDLGLALVDAGKFAESESLFRQAIAITSQMLGSSHVDNGILYRNYGAVLYLTGRFLEAAAVLRRSIEILESSPDAGTARAASLNSLGLVYVAMARYKEAEMLFRMAADVLDQAGENVAAKAVENNLTATIKRNAT